MKRAMGYIRISKDEDGIVSLDYQRAEIEKLCEARWLKPVSIEADEGISGSRDQSKACRPRGS